MNNLCVIILTHNEERLIKECIKSVGFADDILVIDDNSTDKTVEIALKEGARVLTRTLDSFDTQRNFALEHANAGWYLFIDADERVSSNLASEIASVVQNQ